MKQTKSARLHIRLTAQEKKEIERMAKAEGISVSRFLVSISENIRRDYGL